MARVTEIKRAKILPPCNKVVYLRWKNLLGGTDYYLFEHDGESALPVSEGEGITKPIRDLQTAKGISRPLQQQGRVTISVTAENIDESTVHGLRGLMLSHSVQEWRNGLWLDVTITGSNSTYNIRNKLHTVSLTVERQPIYTNRN